MRKIDGIIIHSSYTPPSMDIGVAEIKDWHVNGNGWRDIGYHYVIRRDGTVELGRPVSEPGAHTRGRNSRTIGICLVGGKGEPRANFTRWQYAALEALVLNLKRKHPDAYVKGHRDFDSTKTCPDLDIDEWFNGGRKDD